MIKGVGRQMAERLVSISVSACLISLRMTQSVFRMYRASARPLPFASGMHGRNLGLSTISWCTCRNGLSAHRAGLIFEAYGDRAVERVKQDPFSMTDTIKGIGFLTADELAHQSSSMDRDDPKGSAQLLIMS